MDFTNGMKKAFLASVGAAATTAEVTKDILEKMIEKGERTVTWKSVKSGIKAQCKTESQRTCIYPSD